MKVIILGAGRVGLQLAKELVAEKKEVVIIEKDPSKTNTISQQLDCLVVNDSGNSLEALKAAETKDADFFVGVTESDEINMIACALVSSSFKKPKTIARVRNLDYSETWNPEKGFLGIDHIINPEIEVANAVGRAVEYGAMSNIIQFETSSLQMRNFRVDSESIFCDSLVQDIRSEFPAEFIIAVIMRNEKMLLPEGETRIQAGDQIWVLAEESHFTQLLSFINKKQSRLERIALAGGGNIGSYIVQYLLEDRQKPRGFFNKLRHSFVAPRKRTVHIIENDYALCKQLSERFPSAMITNADISEDRLLEEGRFQNYDLLITATGNQELNIITAAHARKSGIPRSLALVRKSSYAAMARELGIDVAVSINETLVNTIQKIIRRGSVRSVYTISDSNLEILELSLENKPEYTGKPIHTLPLPRESLIIMVTRQGEQIIPTGDLVLQAGDHLMLIVKKESVKDLE